MYIALYRKYRSQSFGEVIGQQHVTITLQNALRLGRIAHAYLFCGPRGCGKTSTARLLARALNCQESDAPTPHPCGVCDLCVRIRDGSAMDVIEMDAASETGIDDVREKIIENAKYAPGEARFKVYIIDEVHDLSLKAFDSLLKTIEEPPPHVVFILATTEAHKVPITVRSRCQRMDFRRGALRDLIDNITRVLEQEGIPFDAEAVIAIARAAEGSFRDSLSLLEQALAYTDGRLTTEAVHASIGTIGPQMLDEIAQTLASDDRAAAFFKAGELAESGKDVKQMLVALQGHLRDLLVAGIAGGPEALTDISPERFTQLKEQTRCFSAPQLLKMLDRLAEAEREIRFTNQHRLLLERAFWAILPSSLTESAVSDQPPAISPQRSAVPENIPESIGAGSAQRNLNHGEQGERPAPQIPTPNTQHLTPNTQHLTPNAQHPTPFEESGRFAGTIDVEGIRRLWPRVIRRVTQVSRAATAIFTDEVQVLAIEGRFIVVGFPDDFKLGRADKPKGRETLEQALAAELGIEGYKVRCVRMDRHSAAEAAPPESAPAMLDLSLESPAKAKPTRNGAPPLPDLSDSNAASPAKAAQESPPVARAEENPADEQFYSDVLALFDGTPVDE